MNLRREAGGGGSTSIVTRVFSPDQATIPTGGDVSRVSRGREAESVGLGEPRGAKTREAVRERGRNGSGGGREERGGGRTGAPRVSEKDGACLAGNLLQPLGFE
jgi:hypothetical protein